MSTEISSRKSSNTRSADQRKNSYPFTRKDINQIKLRSHEFLSPLTKCHSHIDTDDVDTNSREWDISGGWPRKYKRLELLNRGIYNGKWANQELKRGQDDWYMCQNIACQVGLSERLKERLWQIYQNIDLRSYKKYDGMPKPICSIRKSRLEKGEYSLYAISPGLRKHYMVAFCLCALLYNQNKSEKLPNYHPGKEYDDRHRYGAGLRYASNIVDDELNDCHELLEQFAKELRLRDENIRSCMEKLRKKRPEFGN